MALLYFNAVQESADINDLYERAGNRTFIAAATTDCDAVWVRDHCGIQILAQHPSDSAMKVTLLAANGRTDPPSPYQNPDDFYDDNNGTLCYWYDIAISYGPIDPLSHSSSGDPTIIPVVYSFQWQVFEEIVDIAKDPDTGNYIPCVNSCGDPYDPPLTRERLKGIIRVAWNQLDYQPGQFFINANYVNSDVFWGFSPHSIKWSPPSMAERIWSQYLGKNYFRLESEFAIFPNDGNGWDQLVIDRGFRYRVGGVPVKVLDVQGNPVSTPVLLNGAGGIQDPSLGFKQFKYQIYEDMSFTNAFPNLVNLFNS